MGCQEKKLHVIQAVIRDNLIFKKISMENRCEKRAALV